MPSPSQSPTVDPAKIACLTRRADADPHTLSRLTAEERVAYIAGQAERAWRRMTWLAAGMALGACICLLSACGGGSDEQDPDAHLPGPPDCRNHPERCA